ncbi:MAG TPA: hypothetical protein IAA98_15355 [Candidatus Avipropionibacterium avicola]|uniref:Transglutaminase-like domain-containing protein n=1 Tax=Candidatus Avipropionibacterium avicola TaxID=2840701 RepID=A0A9D1KQ06_9ACTN|nr:hypothetical protein [Candidatus Avipropionibacterium avicola]
MSSRQQLVRLAVDSAAVLALLATVCVSFTGLYGGGWVWVAGMGGATLGVLIGALAAWRGWPAWMVAVAVAAAYLLTGSALAMPQWSRWGVLPTAQSLSGLVFGTVQAWKRVLTIDAPIGATDNLLVLPLLTCLVAGVLAITIAARSPRPGLAWLPPAVALVVSIAFGVQTAPLAVPTGLAFVVVALVWTAYRRAQQRHALLSSTGLIGSGALRTVLSGAGVLVIAALVAGLLTPVLVPDLRQVLRDRVEPPLDVRQWPSPLQEFRSNVKDRRTDVLFTVSGLPDGAAVRLATLDAYDGITANPSSSVAGAPDGGRYTRIGTRIPETTPGTSFDYRVRIVAYDDRWVPTVGLARSVTMDGPRAGELTQGFHYNRATGTGVSLDRLRDGDSYRVSAVLARQPDRSELRTANGGALQLPRAEPIPEELAALARDWTSGAGSDGEAAIMLEEQLRRGYYSHGLANDVPSLSGHSAYRMARLALDHDGRMVGDEEQYAVAMALMAREVGLASRVVYGFRPAQGSTEPGVEVPVTGDEVSAWVEINFEGLGWVEFTPTPDKSRALPEDTTRTESKPRPQVENPPPPPDRPEPLPPDNTEPLPGEEDPEPDQLDWAAILRVVAMVAVPLAVVAGPILAVVGLKRRRRRRRAGRGSGLDRIAGGWAELLDRSRDLGVRAQVRATRTENAALLAESVGEDQLDGLRGLAQRADWAAFSGVVPGEETIEQYWHDVRDSSAAAARTVPWWRRWWAVISPWSLIRPWRVS